MSNPAEIGVCWPIIHLPSTSRIRTQTNGFQSHRAVFFDRDGIIIEDIGYLTDASNIKILFGVEEGIRLLQDQFLIIIVTNQSAIARGLMNEDDLLKIHQSLIYHFELDGVHIDAIYSCPHHPEYGKPPYRIRCDGRKPEPGMIQQAAGQFDIRLTKSYLIGDKSSDILAGQRAGVSTTILVRSPKTESAILSEVTPTLVSNSVEQAATQILTMHQSSV